jgi:hypothetical protein
MLSCEAFKGFFYVIKAEVPFLFQIVVLFKTSSNLTLILFVVGCDLRFAFLEDFDFETTFTGPLFAEILV